MIFLQGSDETILDRLSAHALATPSQLAYRFLRDDGESDARALSSNLK